jgi:hypothetical protein
MQACSERQVTTDASAREGSRLQLLVDADARAETTPAAAPTLVYGTVARVAPLAVTLRGASESRDALHAKRAKSCLVAPARGDRVLCSVDGATVHVLTVLDGAPNTRLVADGKLHVRAEGELSLSSAAGIGLSAPWVDIAAESLKMRAKKALAALEELRLLGRSLDAQLADKAVLFAERVEARASRFLQRSKQAFRFISELEQVRAGHYDLRAEGLAAMRGENTIVAARLLAKLDGEQVKIG